MEAKEWELDWERLTLTEKLEALGTRRFMLELFAGSKNHVRVTRLNPESDYVIRFWYSKYPWDIHASTPHEVFHEIVRGMHFTSEERFNKHRAAS